MRQLGWDFKYLLGGHHSIHILLPLSHVEVARLPPHCLSNLSASFSLYHYPESQIIISLELPKSQPCFALLQSILQNTYLMECILHTKM